MRKFIKKFVCIAIIFSLCLCSFTLPAIAKKQRKRQKVNTQKNHVNKPALMNKTMRDWENAEVLDKLTFCRYIVTELYQKGIIKITTSATEYMDEFSPYVLTLIYALDEGFKNAKNDKDFLNTPVYDTSIVVMGLLGWLK